MSAQSSACVMCFFGIASSITGTQRRRLRKTSTFSDSKTMSAGSRFAAISQNTQYWFIDASDLQRDTVLRGLSGESNVGSDLDAKHPRDGRSAPIALIEPFRGLRYDPTRVDPDAVISPPYDVVSDDDVRALLARSPHAVAHIEMRPPGTEQHDYAQAAAALQQWRDEGVMRREDEPVYYLYEQRYTLQGAVQARRCLFARLELRAPEEGVVRFHESTMTGPLDDRLRLLRATETNVSPILAMFEDPQRVASAIFERVAEGEPVFEATDGIGDVHRLWVIDDAEAIDALTAAVAASDVTIADGHHRTQTALNYQREQGTEASSRILVGLITTDDPGLVILPAHRLVKVDRLPEDFVDRLSEHFKLDDITPRSWDGTAVYRLWGRVQANAKGPFTIGILGIENQRLHVATARSRQAIDALLPSQWSPAMRSVDVPVLTEAVLGPLLGVDQAVLTDGERVAFTEDIEHAWSETERGRYDLGFLVNPVRIEQVLAVADAGELLPQKSTYFYPKLATGMVLNPLH